MIDELTLRYAEFVNRSGELKRFCQILEKDEYLVMVVYGESGIGKTSLHKRLIYECREARKVRWAETCWINTRTYNYMTVLRKIRDDIGEIHFQRFTDLLNYFTKANYELKLNVQHAGTINVANNLKAEDSEIENIIGQQIIIQDLNLNEPREDKDTREQERMYKLTQQFIADLAVALKADPAAGVEGDQLVILIDDVEKMTEETGKWLWSEFVRGVMDRGLRNLRFVFCVDNEPQLDEYLGRKVRAGSLEVLDEEHILEYLNKRQVGGESARSDLAKLIFANSHGNPSKMAEMVKLFVELTRNQEEG